MLGSSGLAARIFKAVFGIYLCLAVGVTAVQLWLEFTAIRSTIAADLEALGQSFGPGLSEAIWTYDTPLLASMTRGIAQTAIVTGVRVKDVAGRTLAEAGIVIDPADGDDTGVLAHHVHHVVPLTYASPKGDNRLLGHLVLCSDRSVAVDRVKYSFVMILINSVIKTAGLWLILYLAVTRLLSRPLTQLTAAMRRFELAPEAPGPSLEYSHRDELGMLVETTAEMQVRLAASRRELDEVNRTLADAVERKTAELKRSLEELQRSNTELEQFAYVASHDLREPLRMIVSYLALLERRLNERLSGEEREFMGFAKDGAKRLDALILGILEYSRVGRSTSPEAVPLDEAVAAALFNLKTAVTEAEATVTVADGLPLVHGDRTELTRLFQNLIGNAVKYRVAGRRPEVTVGWQDGGSEWMVFVRDNGIGIDPADHERMFGIFQRLMPRDQYEGTGIGLAVCRKIVQHLGGGITVQSAAGQGACFLLRLPKCQVAMAPPSRGDEDPWNPPHSAGGTGLSG